MFASIIVERIEEMLTIGKNKRTVEFFQHCVKSFSSEICERLLIRLFICNVVSLLFIDTVNLKLVLKRLRSFASFKHFFSFLVNSRCNLTYFSGGDAMRFDTNDSAFPSNESLYKTQGEAQFFMEPKALKIFRFFVYAVIIVFALVGNVAVCVISRRNPRLQTSTFFLLMNLAVSDIGSVLCLPFLLPELYVGNWVMGFAMCKLLKPSVVMFNFVTTNTLVAIACDRFRSVVFPFVARPSTSETRLILSLLWLIALLFSLPSYEAMKVIYYPQESHDLYCSDMFSSDQELNVLYRRIYTLTMYTLQVVLPVLVISTLTLKITATLKDIRLFPVALRPTRASSLNSTPNASPHSSLLNLNKLNMNSTSFIKRQEMEKKFLRMLMTVLLVFVLCYVPFQTVYLVYEFHPMLFTGRYMQSLSEFLYLLVWLPNALNPVCYGFLNEHYKRAFKALIFHPRKFYRMLKLKRSFSQSVLSNALSKLSLSSKSKL